ncbi:MAG: hypothetical protein MUC94_18565, partial [bacterium]|nr:hypothetical protein [bacterium]
FLDMDYDWTPAFKVGLGYHINYDNWNLFLQYTRYNSVMTNRFSVEVSNEFLADKIKILDFLDILLYLYHV